MDLDKLAELLKPSDTEIRELALRETDPARISEFQPIVRGPGMAVVILSLVAVAAIPLTLMRIATKR